MNIYKITNITNLAGKRDYKFNSEVDIEYIDGITKKTIKVKAGETVFLTVSSLPLSVHRLRVKGLISVTEVGAAELNKSINDAKPKVAKIAVDEEDAEKKNVVKTVHGKKKLTNKEEVLDIEKDT